MCARGACRPYQEGAEHVEADEVDDGEAAATALLPRLRVTIFARHTGQHYLLPCFTCRTPGEEKGQLSTYST